MNAKKAIERRLLLGALFCAVLMMVNYFAANGRGFRLRKLRPNDWRWSDWNERVLERERLAEERWREPGTLSRGAEQKGCSYGGRGGTPEAKTPGGALEKL
jgi:hypothetical protein